MGARSQSRMRCWQELVRRTSSPSASTTPLERRLLWQVVKQAREQELKDLRELRVYEKVDEHAAVTKLLPESSKAGTGQTCMGNHPLEALIVIISIAVSHSPEFSLMHVDVFPCILPCQGSDACASEIASKRLLRKG